MNHPENFLEIVIHGTGAPGDNLGLCAGFERGNWRNDQLADHILEWLPEFALGYSELKELGPHNAIRKIKKAAKIVYQTHKYGNRGEFGELLLHIAICQTYNTIPAVSKIYYKSSVNKTVEGFDAVHVVKNNDRLELWIGESKFYTSIDTAIRDVSKEIVEHLETDYLRSEFILIKNKIDPNWEEANELKNLLNESTSLDTIFDRACIPVMLTYESPVVGKTSKSDSQYLFDIQVELSSAFIKMRQCLDSKYKKQFGSDLPISVHVFLIPLKDKKSLIAALDARLKALQV